MFGMRPGFGGAMQGAMFGKRPQAAPAKPMPQRPGGMPAMPMQRPPAAPMGAAPRMAQMRAPMQQAKPMMMQRQAQPPGGIMGRIGAMGGQRQSPFTGGGAPNAGMAMGGMLSDEKSKEKIRELEGIRDRYEALLDTPSSVAQSFRGVSANEFEYKDPTAQGAAPGTQTGPMASELRSLPGVVQRGPDGMDRVNPDRLSLANASAMGETSREVDELRARLAALEDNPDAVLREASGGR